ncbi:MAG: AMP-binding protein, partial [Pseudomonadota bacterium]
ETFGMTETGIAVFFNSFIRERKIGSIGFPMADMDARIMDLQTGTREMPVGEEGELVIKGPPIMKHYLNLPEETKNALRDGWLYTGDIARMDEDGFFWVVDRKKDMIMASGFKVFPREIDEVLHEHPQIDLACAVGVPDPYRGETVKAFVVLKPGRTLTEEEVIEFCRQRLAAYKAPRMVEFRDSLPTSAAGKVLRKMLREEELKKQEGR